MAFNGSGVFNRLYTWVNDAAAAVKIRANRMDNEMNGFATGLTNCVTRDGQSPATANLPMGGYKHTNVANASSATEYAAYGQLLAKVSLYCTVGGTANAITLSSGASVSAYTAGMMLHFISSAANTSTVTVSLDGLAAKSVVKRGSSSLSSGDIISGSVCVIVYDGTNFQLVSVRLIKTEDIQSQQVTYAKIQNVSATDKILGRSSAGSGSIEEITCTAAGRALLDDADVTAQLATLGLDTLGTMSTEDTSRLAPDVILTHTLAAGTDGGSTSSATWNKCPINTENRDTLTICSVASDQITLSAGTYYIFAQSSVVASGVNKLRLRNVTDGSTTLVGNNTYNSPLSPVSGSYANLTGVFTISGSKTFELQHYTATGRATDGFGIAVGSESEIYRLVTIRKIA